MEGLVQWIEKRIDKLRSSKKIEEQKDNRDLEKIRRIGGKLSGYKEVLGYINKK